MEKSEFFVLIGILVLFIGGIFVLGYMDMKKDITMAQKGFIYVPAHWEKILN